jgi:hypothetical protein
MAFIEIVWMALVLQEAPRLDFPEKDPLRYDQKSGCVWTIGREKHGATIEYATEYTRQQLVKERDRTRARVTEKIDRLALFDTRGDKKKELWNVPEKRWMESQYYVDGRGVVERGFRVAALASGLLDEQVLRLKGPRAVARRMWFAQVSTAFLGTVALPLEKGDDAWTAEFVIEIAVLHDEPGRATIRRTVEFKRTGEGKYQGSDTKWELVKRPRSENPLAQWIVRAEERGVKSKGAALIEFDTERGRVTKAQTEWSLQLMGEAALDFGVGEEGLGVGWIATATEK